MISPGQPLPIPASEPWLVWRMPRRPAAENMAVDEALLEYATLLEKPVLRLYAWSEPAATFGYFQHYDEVAQATPLRPLVRRPTGGGIVPHDNDWTYSLIFPPAHYWHRLSARESYQRVHGWIQEAFGRLRVATELSPLSRHDIPGQCFAGAEQFDVLWQQRKIAGAAQRRNKLGLLIQGSIQPPGGKPAGGMHLDANGREISKDRADWESAFLAWAAEQWGVRWMELEPSPELLARAAALAAEKYSRDEFNRRR